jgi:hypothetical protein
MLSSLFVLSSTAGLALAKVTTTTTNSTNLITPESSTTAESTRMFYVIHGWLLWVAWGIFGLIQISTTRYLKTQWRYGMWIHGISGVIIMMLTIVLGLMAGGGSKGAQ